MPDIRDKEKEDMASPSKELGLGSNLGSMSGESRVQGGRTGGQRGRLREGCLEGSKRTIQVPLP